MKKLLIFSLFSFTFVFATSAIPADVHKGLEAYKKRDFITTMLELDFPEQGDPEAQMILGIMYRNGQGVQRNIKTALKWYKLAAEQGHAIAQSTLGGFYRNGKVVAQDYKMALKWFTRAAKQGSATSQYALSSMYLNGLGVQRNDSTSIKWLILAAEQEKTFPVLASTVFGTTYMEGSETLKKDFVRAHMWLNIASAHGSPSDGKRRDELENQMTPTQIETALKLARECKERNYKGC